MDVPSEILLLSPQLSTTALSPEDGNNAPGDCQLTPVVYAPDNQPFILGKVSDLRIKPKI